MLGKLLKFDIKFGRTPYLAIMGMLLLFGLLARLFSAQIIWETPVGLVFSLLMVAVVVAMLILVFQNFNRSMFGNEGYLTLTLPVKRHKLLLSKLLISVLWFNLMLLAVILTAIILYTQEWALPEQGISMMDILTLVNSVIIANLWAVNAILLLYMAITAAHVSAAGRRPGWVLGVGVLAVVVILEILAGIKILNPLFDGRMLWMYQEAPGSAVRFAVAQRLGDVLNTGGLSGYHSSFSVSLVAVILPAVFAVLSWPVTLQCIKKRVDLP